MTIPKRKTGKMINMKITNLKTDVKENTTPKRANQKKKKLKHVNYEKGESGTFAIMNGQTEQNNSDKSTSGNATSKKGRVSKITNRKRKDQTHDN